MKVSLFISFFLMSFSLLVGQPVADFSSDVTQGCGNTIITFTNNSTGYTSLELDFGDGSPIVTSFSGPIVHVYTPGTGQPGNYTVTLVVRDGAQNDADNISITIYNKPTAVINADTTRGCANLDVNFNSTGSLPGDGASLIEYIWTFGDGDGSSLSTPPTHTYLYRSTGYTVSLEVKDANCSSITFKNDYIRVSLPPNINITGVPSNIGCGIPYNVTLINSASNIVNIQSYEWDFGDGNTSDAGNSVDNIYTAYGTYDVSLTIVDDNYCPNTVISPGFISVENVQSAFTIDDALCTGATIPFISTSIGAVNYKWRFGDGDTSIIANTSHVYTQEQNARVSLIIDNGNVCVDSLSFDVFIQDVSADFGMDTSWACTFPSAIPVNLTDSSTNNVITWDWEFEDGGTSNLQNPTYSFSDENDIKLVVESFFGCKDSITKTFELRRPDVSIFVDTTLGCVPLSVTFRDSTEALSSITNRLWDFGDGNNYSSALVDTANNIFLTPDTFYTVLTITDASCGDEKDSIMITPGDVSVVDFTFDNPSCAAEQILFTDNSTPADSISEWFWSFGDTISVPVEEQNPIYNYYKDTVMEVFNGVCDWWEPYFTYTSPQTLWVSLTVGYNGCYTTDSLQLTLDGPIVDIDSIIHDCSNPLEYRVALDTIVDATKVEATFFSTTGGTDVTVTKYYGALVSLRDTIDVTLTEDEYVLRVTAYDTISNCEHEVFYNEWSGLLSCSLSPLQENIPICVSDPVIASFTFSPDTLCAYEQVHLDASGSSANATSFEWFVRHAGDTVLYSLTTTTTNVVDLAPYIAGNLDIILVTRACDLCTDTMILPGLVSYQPTAVYSLSDSVICAPDTITLKITSINSILPITEYLWGFGDFITESKTDTTFVKHGYSLQGSYFPGLTLTDSYGCVSSDSTLLLVSRANPMFSISSKICPGYYPSIGGTDMSQDFYIWDYGDGSDFDTLYFPITTPTKIYPFSGNYNVVLTTSVNGCLASDTNLLEVIQYPDVGFTSNTRNISCWSDFETVIFTDTTNSENVSGRRWNVGAGFEGLTTETDRYHVYMGPGSYNVSLRIYTKVPSNCYRDYTANSYITVGGSYAEMAQVTSPVCRNQTQLFSRNTISFINNPINFSWDFDDGNIVSGNSAWHSFSQSGDFTINMYYNDGAGCSSLDPNPKTVTVKPLSANFSLSDTLCGPNSTMELNNTSIDYLPDSVEWDTDWGIFTSDDLTRIINSIGTYPVKLTVFDNTGCMDTITKAVNVYPIPTASILRADSVLCIGDNTQLESPFYANYTYEWTPTGIMSNSEIYNPIATPLSDGDIILNVIDNTSTCIFSDTSYIYLQEIPNIDISYYFPRNDSTYQLIDDIIRIPIGDTVQLLAGSTQQSITYIWDDNPELTCTNCYNPFTDPEEHVVFTVTALDSLGCNYNDATRTIYIEVIPPRIIMPTAFTPNESGDQRNELYKVMGPGISKLLEFKIYNRWGQMMFSTEDINQGWDGTYNEKKQNVDTYVYYVKIETVKGEVLEKKGAFSLLR